MPEQSYNILQITNHYADEIDFVIEPYGMIYTIRRDQMFTVQISGTPSQNIFEINIKNNSISVYGTRETMSIFNEQGIKLDF